MLGLPPLVCSKLCNPIDLGRDSVACIPTGHAKGGALKAAASCALGPSSFWVAQYQI